MSHPSDVSLLSSAADPFPPRERERLPSTGGVLAVASPMNGAKGANGQTDAPRLLAALIDLRPDVLLLAADSDADTVAEAIGHARRGGLVLFFLPASDAGDPTALVRVARGADVPIVPLLVRASEPFRVRVGHPIPAGATSRFEADRELADYLRLRTALLGRDGSSSSSGAPARRLEPLAEPIDPAEIAREIGALPPDRKLASGSGLEVWLARAPEIERTLLEIGRLREKTFRAADEGTGEPRDLDRFDRFYLHLMLFDPRTRTIAGGYRLGPTEELRRRHPDLREVLYSATLFDLGKAFLDRVAPAIELGRSFVVAEHQRRPLALDLLWRGVGAFVARHAEYGHLFGPVSISASYSALSRELMYDHLRHGLFDPALARAVRPRTPPLALDRASLGVRWSDAMVGDASEVSRMVSDIDGKGLPVLVREYSKLGGRFVGFNRDAAFGDCVDGLVIVDLAAMPERYRRRYLVA